MGCARRGSVSIAQRGMSEPIWSRSRSASTSSWRSALPPIHCWLIPDDLGGDLGSPKVAELPQFLRRARVLEESPVDAEGIQLAFPEVVYRGAHAIHQRSQLALVVGPDDLPRSLPVGPGGHRSRVVRRLTTREVRHVRTLLQGAGWEFKPVRSAI